MSLLQKIKQHQVEARLQRELVKTNLLTTLIGEASMIGKNKGNRETTDEEVVGVIQKFIKSIDETIKIKTDRGDDVTSEQTEREILEQYLPKQLTEEQIKQLVAQHLRELNETPSMKMMGSVMGWLRREYAGQFDGKVASSIIRDILNG